MFDLEKYQQLVPENPTPQQIKEAITGAGGTVGKESGGVIEIMDERGLVDAVISTTFIVNSPFTEWLKRDVGL